MSACCGIRNDRTTRWESRNPFPPTLSSHCGENFRILLSNSNWRILLRLSRFQSFKPLNVQMFELSNVFPLSFSFSSSLSLALPFSLPCSFSHLECKPDYQSKPDQLPAASNITLVLVKWFPPAVKVSSVRHTRWTDWLAKVAFMNNLFTKFVIQTAGLNRWFNQRATLGGLRFEVTDLCVPRSLVSCPPPKRTELIEFTFTPGAMAA